MIRAVTVGKIPRQSIKKQRHHFATEVHILKAMTFPVVKYGCESWTVRKQSVKGLLLSNCGAGEDSRESLGQKGGQTSQS